MINPKSWMFVNGRYVRARDARISPLDRGFIIGDGIFETLRVYENVPFLFQEHMQRLHGSARALKISLPYNAKEFESITRRLLAKNKLKNAAVRITISRGMYQGGLAIDRKAKPTVVVFMWEFTGYPKESYEKGAGITLTRIPPFSPALEGIRVKSVNYLNNIIAYQIAQDRGAQEAIMTTLAGKIAEGSTSNLFFWNGKILKTPSRKCGILPGITRDLVFKLAQKEKIQVEEGEYLPSEIKKAREVFITSSLREVLPVTKIDGKKVGDGKPGPITHVLHQSYQNAVESAIQKKQQ